jgi:hypothetical protein
MNATNRYLMWWLLNGLFVLGLYHGYVEQNEGAERVVYFIAWANIIVSFFYLNETMLKAMEGKRRSVPMWLNTSFDIAVACFFAWHGLWVVAAFWFIHLCLQEGMWAELEKRERLKSDGFPEDELTA